MFERAYIKEISKQRMRGFRGNAILVCLIFTFLCGGGSSFNFNFNADLPTDAGEITGAESWMEELESVLGALVTVTAVAAVIAVLYSVFVANVINTGCKGWFLRYWRGEYPSVGELFASFRIYLPVMVTNLLRDIYVFLWMLLFIIPGIVKGIAYSMADYIIYENPNLSAGDALRLSQRLTDGAKWDLFVFNLSFFGWELLNVFTLGILGIVYVNPYRSTAHAGIYEFLKASAINSGRMTWQDFGQQPPMMPSQEPPAPPQEPVM